MQTGTSDLARSFARQIAERRIELPPMPATASEVVSLCQQETTDAARLSAVVHRDQALASNVLRVANSAAYMGQVPCASLQQAISRLGMRLVGEIAMAVAVRGPLFQHAACAELLALVWQHSVLTGFFAKEIARLDRRNVEIAFPCGLLHDVGEAVLLGTFVRELKPGDALPPARELLAAAHAHHVAAGQLLAGEWKLPDQIVESIEGHHAPAATGKFAELATTVTLADAIAHHVAPSPLCDAVGEEDLRQHVALDVLNIYPDQLDTLLAMRERALLVTEGLR